MVTAATRGDAESVLAERGHVIVVLRTETVFERVHAALVERIRRPSRAEIVGFLRQFAVMVSARMPVVLALRSIAAQTRRVGLRAVVLDLVRAVESGVKLSDAFAAHPHVFSDFATHLLRAGETSGTLDAVLGYLADQAERDRELQSRVRGAMVYPSFILGGLATVAFLMLTFVLPRLTAVLAETGAELPFLTRLLIAVSAFAEHWWWLVLSMGTIAAVGFRVSLRAPAMRMRWDTVKLHIPVIGAIGQEVAVVRFAQSLHMLLRGGVGTVPSLGVVSGVMGNAAYRQLIDRTIRAVEDGSSIAAALQGSRLMPDMATQLIAIGEASGQLDHVLAQLGQYHERLVEQHIRNLVTTVEPMVMIILGLAVGVMVSAVIMPMYQLASRL